MTEPLRILVVCVGNVCRSPLAAALLSDGLPDARVGSAGTGAVVGRPMHPLAEAELRRLGGDPGDFVARQLVSALVEEADLVLTATTDVRTQVLRTSPRAMRRAFTLAELAQILDSDALPGAANRRDLVATAAAHRHLAHGLLLDVADPVGKDEAVHRTVADEIARHTRGITAGFMGLT